MPKTHTVERLNHIWFYVSCIGEHRFDLWWENDDPKPTCDKCGDPALQAHGGKVLTFGGKDWCLDCGVSAFTTEQITLLESKLDSPLVITPVEPIS